MLMAKSDGYNTYVMIFLVHLQAHVSWSLKVQQKPGKQTINRGYYMAARGYKFYL